jgi:hypothetical protein
MTSKNRQQLELLPERDVALANPRVMELTPEVIKIIRSRSGFVDAWNFAREVSGLDIKQVYGALRVDPSHVTKIQSERASPPGRIFNTYLNLLQNEFPLIWWAESRGYDWLSIRRHRTAEQRELDELRKENAELKSAMRVTGQYMWSGRGT